MSRYDYNGRGDTRDFTDGDTRFIGIDMTRDRGLLQPGMLALGENGRTRTGGYVQRPGTFIPSDFNPVFEATFVGSGVFRDPNGEEILLIAPANKTYVHAVEYGKDPYRINYSAAAIAANVNNGVGGVDFVQSFDKVTLLKRPIGVGQVNLVWDGTGDTNGDGIADTTFDITVLSGTGIALVPPHTSGEPFQDRIIFYDANTPTNIARRDTWLMSDILDYTSYDPVFQVIRTNPGESDYITRIMGYFHSSVIVFKNRSIHQVTLLPVFPVSVQQRVLSLAIGSVGKDMPLEVGGDVIFLSDRGGFYRLSEVVEEQVTTLPIAISEPIQEIIDQINWPATRSAGCSTQLDNYALFGIAIAPSFNGCNAILVYNTQSRQWESAPDRWMDANFGFNKLHITNYAGIRRIFAVDYQNSAVYLMYEGLGDDLRSGFFPVPFKVETRGYVGDDPFSFKRYLRATANFATSNPSIKVTAISDGINEE
jgi:hypothetical protein